MYRVYCNKNILLILREKNVFFKLNNNIKNNHIEMKYIKKK